MRISLVVAVSENNVIGQEGNLPWRLSADLKKFKKLTTGHRILMGRKTYESIGRPLPNRRNVVITRNPDYLVEGVEIFSSLEKALEVARSQNESEIFIIGGGEIYRQCLDYADRIYLSRVKVVLEGDTFFPELDLEEWQEIEKQEFKADEKNDYDFDFIILERSGQKR